MEETTLQQPWNTALVIHMRYVDILVECGSREYAPNFSCRSALAVKLKMGLNMHSKPFCRYYTTAR